MKWRIDELVANELVRWSCTEHTLESWRPTTLAWRIKAGPSGVLVALEHGGWASEPPAAVVEGWKYFLASLRSYLETGTGQPW